MAEVWLVQHPALQRRFALKVVRAATASLTERISREARAQASVHHPFVLDVLDVFEIDGRPALLLPLVEGRAAPRGAGPDIPRDADRTEVRAPGFRCSATRWRWRPPSTPPGWSTGT